jgi:SAM-dependent methyltransferase
LNETPDKWFAGSAYERFMGRWSTHVARKFIAWLAVAPGSTWLDVGCGTGTLTRAILETGQPKEVIALDSSREFISYAQQSIPNSIARFQVGLAQALELESNSVEAVVSGLVLNFVPQPESAIAEMVRVAKPDGTIGIFLWDYAEGMEMLRYFWDAAVELDPRAADYDEGIRFPICREGQLETLFKETGLRQVEAIPIEVPTIFQSFADYWEPFLGNVGPAPGYAMSLSPKNRQKLEQKLRDSLPIAEDGSISLVARAWAVKGRA